MVRQITAMKLHKQGIPQELHKRRMFSSHYVAKETRNTSTYIIMMIISLFKRTLLLQRILSLEQAEVVVSFASEFCCGKNVYTNKDTTTRNL